MKTAPFNTADYLDSRGAIEAYVAETSAEIGRLLRCIASIEDELTRDPPRIGDALFVCEAARAGTALTHQQQAAREPKS